MILPFGLHKDRSVRKIICIYIIISISVYGRMYVTGKEVWPNP